MLRSTLRAWMNYPVPWQQFRKSLLFLALFIPLSLLSSENAVAVKCIPNQHLLPIGQRQEETKARTFYLSSGSKAFTVYFQGH